MSFVTTMEEIIKKVIFFSARKSILFAIKDVFIFTDLKILCDENS